MRLQVVASIAVLVLLSACQGTQKFKIRPTPKHLQVVQWPVGTRFVATVANNLPDTEKWRAVKIWWRHALGQTQRFTCTTQNFADRKDLPRLELNVATDAKTLAVSLHEGADVTAIAKGTFGNGSTTPDLLMAIDHLAWVTRLALGEPASQPKPIGAITSADAKVVLAVADATDLMQVGSFVSAHKTLRQARQRDGGSPYLLDQLASMELLRGDPSAAERISREALSYEDRTSATVQHRLARTLLMARSAGNASNAGDYDRQLHVLASVARQERPFDDEPIWTAALAHNFTGQFEQARPLLEELLRRQPKRAFIPYHLGWACLGMNDATSAADHLETAAKRLPAPWILLPRTIALFEAGRHQDVEDLLQQVLDEYGSGGQDSLTHDVRRMQAAHAILTGATDRARQLLLQDLNWLSNHPLALSSRVGEFAEEGAVLVRLGSNDELLSILSTVQKQHPLSAVADASAFLAGMHQVQTTGIRAIQIERALSRDGDSAWSALLEAFGHERLGHVGEMQNALARAARMSSAPSTKALLAKSLMSVGKVEAAQRLHVTLKREMRQIHLRRPCQHPLFGPELAYAFVAL